MLEQNGLENLRQRADLFGLHRVPRCLSASGQNPRLEGKMSRIGDKRHELVVSPNQPLFQLEFIFEQNAIQALARAIEIFRGDVAFQPQQWRDDRRGNDLPVRMTNGRAGRLPVILEDDDRLKPLVSLEIEIA